MSIPARTPAHTSTLVLREYQREGVAFLTEKRRALLTDAAGLGKSLTAAEAAERPVLVVAPSYLAIQWAEFLTAQYPEDLVLYAYGTRQNRQRILDLAVDNDADWLIINIEMLRSYSLPSNIKTVIFDEAHRLRNHRSAQGKAASALCKDPSLRVYELTASPIWREPDDLYHLLHLLHPTIFKTHRHFVETYCNVIPDPYAGFKVVSIKKRMRQQLRQTLDLMRLGRTYKQVGRQLPPIIEKQVKIEFPPEVAKLYKTLRDGYRIEIGPNPDDRIVFQSAGAVMHALRKVTANSGKSEATIEILREVFADPNAKPALIFTWYREHARQLSQDISAAKLPGITSKQVGMITGEMPPDQRLEVARTSKILVANIAALSEGLNLQHFRTVIYYEMDYTPGANYQTLARVRRDRNDAEEGNEPVLVYWVMVTKSIDEKIYRISKRRAATIRDVLLESLED
jgi:SNF2 family DNA or RNA helicase